MKIINPIYDFAFKYLMEEKCFAKMVLSVILDTEIETVSLEQQESVYEDGSMHTGLFRLDFRITMKNEDGSLSTFLIELHKSKFPTDIEHFWNYMGFNYITHKDDKSISNDKEQMISEPVIKHRIYPVIKIYILGYELSDLPYLAVTARRNVIDWVSKKKITSESVFLEHLTYQTNIIQVKRLPAERRTPLERFFTLFNQAWRSDWDFILDLQDVPEEFEDIARHLQEPLSDEQFCRNLEVERKTGNAFYELEFRIQQEEKLRKEAESKAAQYLIEKEKERRQKESLMEKMLQLAKMLKERGTPVDEIAKQTGFSAVDITKL